MTYRKNKSVILGLSGGVDSTAAALLLMEKGYDVTGLYFDVNTGTSSGEMTKGHKEAERAAMQLGIDLIYRDLTERFEEKVIAPFCSEYMRGRTPNPCIMCNPLVKFAALKEAADERDASYIATGHYAGTFFDSRKNIWHIKKGASEKKDQSYMLYRLGQEIISRLILPLGEAAGKEEVRAAARERKMENSEAKDSQEICFIEEGKDYRDFLRERGMTFPPGDFTDTAGNVIGRHKGIQNYTIGQRKGLGVAAGKPVFAVSIDAEKNRVVLGERDELFSARVISDSNIIEGREYGSTEESAAKSMRVKAKIRYAAPPAEAVIEDAGGGRILATFKEPQRAVTPGQSIVFYDGDIVIGGGIISG